jgi:hypothetical protein
LRKLGISVLKLDKKIFTKLHHQSASKHSTAQHSK